MKKIIFTPIFRYLILGIFTTTGLISCNSEQSEKTQIRMEPAYTAALTEAHNEKTDTLHVEEAPLSRMASLNVIVDNLKSATAPVEICLYNSKSNFLIKDKYYKKYRFIPKNGKVEAKLDGLHYGEFAVALYQDINGNGKIDKNMLGIPKEPYAFSNNFIPLLKPPCYGDCKFNYSAKSNAINISLIK